MPDVLRPYHRADHWLKSLSRLRYTLVMTTVALFGVLLGVIFSSRVNTDFTLPFIVVFAVSNYAFYPWIVGDSEWSFLTNGSNGRE